MFAVTDKLLNVSDKKLLIEIIEECSSEFFDLSEELLKSERGEALLKEINMDEKQLREGIKSLDKLTIANWKGILQDKLKKELEETTEISEEVEETTEIPEEVEETTEISEEVEETTEISEEVEKVTKDKARAVKVNLEKIIRDYAKKGVDGFSIAYDFVGEEPNKKLRDVLEANNITWEELKEQIPESSDDYFMDFHIYCSGIAYDVHDEIQEEILDSAKANGIEAVYLLEIINVLRNHEFKIDNEIFLSLKESMGIQDDNVLKQIVSKLDMLPGDTFYNFSKNLEITIENKKRQVSKRYEEINTNKEEQFETFDSSEKNLEKETKKPSKFNIFALIKNALRHRVTNESLRDSQNAEEILRKNTQEITRED